MIRKMNTHDSSKLVSKAIYIFYLSFLGEPGKCSGFEVIGGSSTTSGAYLASGKRAKDAPNSLVWKKLTADRYIFNTGCSKGWRIGDEASLKDGTSYFKSKKDS